jgi:hypothetical protein
MFVPFFDKNSDDFIKGQSVPCDARHLELERFERVVDGRCEGNRLVRHIRPYALRPYNLRG